MLVKRVDCALNQSQSQFREDLLLLPTLTRAVGGLRGTFVELGALDGRKFSNSVMLEECFGWRGLLIEANPLNFARLNVSGRGASLVHSAVCQLGQQSVRLSLEGGETAGELKYLTKGRRKARAAHAVDIPCEPLGSIMARHGFGAGADFLSLDVEGA